MYYQESAFAKPFAKRWLVFYHIVGFAQTRAQTNPCQCNQGWIKHQVDFFRFNKFYKLKLHDDNNTKFISSQFPLIIFFPFGLCDATESALSTPLSSSRARSNRLARINTDERMNVRVTCPRPGAETPRGRLRTLSGPTSLWLRSVMFQYFWLSVSYVKWYYWISVYNPSSTAMR